MRVVRFKPHLAEEWGVKPTDRFIVRKTSPSGRSVYINLRGNHLSHISTSVLLEENTVADTEIRPAEAPMPIMEEAKELVRSYVQVHLDKSDPEVQFEVYIVWFSKTLLNWKALISTTLPDKMYYELTHDGANYCTYLDAYLKIDNRKVMDEGY